MKRPIITENQIKIPSSQEYLPDVDIFVEGRLAEFGVNESAIADIAISVTELVNNAITHGNKSVFEKTVIVDIGKSNSTVEISVTDEGNGFNPDEVENPIDDKNLLKEVGRGIFITRSLMDKVEFNSRPGRGTKVTIKKHI
nr:ATP-binding protein [candidate division Zixibacteria bacterium]